MIIFSLLNERRRLRYTAKSSITRCLVRLREVGVCADVRQLDRGTAGGTQRTGTQSWEPGLLPVKKCYTFLVQVSVYTHVQAWTNKHMSNVRTHRSKTLHDTSPLALPDVPCYVLQSVKVSDKDQRLLQRNLRDLNQPLNPREDDDQAR